MSDKSLPVAMEATCNQEVDDYFSGIKCELGQAERLVSDAVNNLVINFNYISKLTRSHCDMVLAIEEMAIPENSNGPILKLLRQQMEIADKIDQELVTVITSLQFGDLVAQLLNHTAHQVDTLNTVLQRIDRQRIWKNDSCNLDETQHVISSAVAAANAASRSKPVVQQGMQKGEIELF